MVHFHGSSMIMLPINTLGTFTMITALSVVVNNFKKGTQSGKNPSVGACPPQATRTTLTLHPSHTHTHTHTHTFSFPLREKSIKSSWTEHTI